MSVFLATPTTDLVSATAACLAAVFALIALIVAYFQLGGLRSELRLSGLMAVLEIESQMSDRKVKLDELSREVEDLARQLQSATAAQKPQVQAKIDAVKPFFDSACENYLNAVDRLCYCILHGYLADRDWRTEYRNYIHDTIVTYDGHFKTGTPFRNIVELDKKWQST